METHKRVFLPPTAFIALSLPSGVVTSSLMVSRVILQPSDPYCSSPILESSFVQNSTMLLLVWHLGRSHLIMFDSGIGRVAMFTLAGALASGSLDVC